MAIKRVVIFTGGNLGGWALSHILADDLLIGADSGALFLIMNGFTPDLAIGDFDSVSGQELSRIRSISKVTEQYDPVDKDYTDTELAFREALSLNPQEVVLIGALGTRFDHSIANIHLLVMAQQSGISASIVDEHNEIRLVTDKLTIRQSGYANVSLLPLTPQVQGINLHGFRYPLHNAKLIMGQSLGISNVLEAASGQITIEQGWLLVIQSRD
ncbi:thiamine diphosphokinase [Paenibacillus abyssi]|uniref:Thiamine diphosphokinase n=1 Tax=Paenibacillus abyssi TaxID=1340531 RepID=A0A917CIT0_9BACL|nr:thiamine diphosphokinase [Paenibacillus abyssi]GGF89954.1 thiamine pyrophosphokinase [Paenibacillus abyssi]